MISEAGLSGSKPEKTPMEQNLKLTSTKFDKIVNGNTDDSVLEDRSSFQRLDKRGLGLLMSRNSTERVQGYCDSDCGSCPMYRKSITGFYIMLGSSLISWKAKKQTTISRSLAKDGYRSMAHTVAELTWLNGLLKELMVDIKEPMELIL
ncbi:secreted RxLR effector protein 161-like [Nicotiana tabacum]|uniref:Secreted RxLR effector protein 161-like n=1 Tax=Nicotiana tabacum TaxID=4097 RepID=A0AC58U400_TOBAC